MGSLREGDPMGGALSPASPEAQAALRAFKQTFYSNWADQPVPALDGVTPREATTNPALRARLELLLIELEEQEERSPAPQRFDVTILRRQLRM